MSAGQYGTYGLSDQVAQLMNWSLFVVAPAVLAGLALGIVVMLMDRKRQATLECVLAVISIMCNLGGGLVYLLGWFWFGLGSEFH